MRTTIFELREGHVETDIVDRPEWRSLPEYDGHPLERVRDVAVRELPQASMQLVEIGTGGSFAMHSSPDVAFCQVVRGRGALGLPDGRELAYEAPELYVFLPETLHDWHDVREDTLLAVCVVKGPVVRSPP
jgi:quercetin dioxygenase-like cupin family protein